MPSEEKLPPEPPPEETAEKFPRGRVARFFPQSRYGFIKDRNGRDVYFNLDEVRFVGGKDHRQLQEGVEVGYDLGWTSHGEHVVKMKIY
ncbi:MAG: hypothetical protein U1F66_11315 [bacterium]